MSARIRVMLADDHAVVRAGYRFLLENVEDIEVVGEARILVFSMHENAALVEHALQAELVRLAISKGLVTV